MKSSVIGFLSSAWLIPFSFGFHCYLQLFRRMSDSQIHGLVEVNSFPYQDAMLTSLFIGEVWLGVVIFGWTTFAAYRFSKK